MAQSALSLSRLGFAAFRVSWRLVGAATARLTAQRSDFRRGGCSDIAVGGGLSSMVLVAAAAARNAGARKKKTEVWWCCRGAL